MFSIDIDPLTECFMRVVARYPGCATVTSGTGTYFVTPHTAAAEPGTFSHDDLLDRLSALAAERGTTLDRTVLHAALKHCADQPLVTEVSPFRYTVA